MEKVSGRREGFWHYKSQEDEAVICYVSNPERTAFRIKLDALSAFNADFG